MRQLQRDPFARATLVKDDPLDRDCAWRGGRDAHGKVWAYFWKPDAMAPYYISGLRHFCGVGCYRSYHS